MDPHDTKLWARSKVASLIRGFWSTDKDMDYGIKKVFITGVTTLLSDLGSGFNEQQNKTFHQDYSTMCRLTQLDIQGALRAIWNDEKTVEMHLKEPSFYTKGYHFCDKLPVEIVFNTQTALVYLQVS